MFPYKEFKRVEDLAEAPEGGRKGPSPDGFIATPTELPPPVLKPDEYERAMEFLDIAEKHFERTAKLLRVALTAVVTER